jgi:hypothetical protein
MRASNLQLPPPIIIRLLLLLLLLPLMMMPMMPMMMMMIIIFFINMPSNIVIQQRPSALAWEEVTNPSISTRREPG